MEGVSQKQTAKHGCLNWKNNDTVILKWFWKYFLSSLIDRIMLDCKVYPPAPPPPHPHTHTHTHTHTNTHTYTSFTDIATYHKSKNYFIISQSIFIWWGSSLIELHGISPRFVVYQFIEIKLFLCNPRQPYEIDISFIRYIFPYFLYIS